MMADPAPSDSATVREAGAGPVAPTPAPGELATISTETLLRQATEKGVEMAALTGCFLQLVGELDRRQGWRAEGATSLEAWMSARCGLSAPTARAYAHVARRLWDLPCLTEAVSEGEISFDQVRVVIDAATPETDRRLRDEARAHTPRELSDLVRRASRAGPHDGQQERRSLRFNDTCRTVVAQLPPESYAAVRGRLEARARQIPSDGETPWDHRLCDAFVSLLGSRGSGTSSPHLVVTHVPLAALREEGSELAGELERVGLISTETVRLIACDATIVLAVDDDVGHTMYEGRTRRFPSDAQRREIVRRDRHCRFPGCAHVTFTNAHHVRPWQPDGRTDLQNLVLLCEHHHRMVHSRHWSVSGNANDVLTFVGPTGRVSSSRPSPLWTVATWPGPPRVDRR